MMYIRIAIFVVSILGLAGTVAGARHHWINEGKSLCQNAAATAAQEKVIDNDKKLRPIRSHRPSVKRLADRMLNDTF